MTRFIFLALQAFIFLTTLFMGLDVLLQHSLSLSLIAQLPIELTLRLGDLGFAAAGEGGGAVCPFTCDRDPLMGALSLYAVVLSGRHLWRQVQGGTPPVPSAFGPFERRLASAGLMLMALTVATGAFFTIGHAILELFVRLVTFSHIGASRLAQWLLAIAFWLAELKPLWWHWRARRAEASR
jgi:hypothetical protein